MTTEVLSSIQIAVLLFLGGSIWYKLGCLTQEVKDHKEKHETDHAMIESIKTHCPLCTQEKVRGT